MKLEFLGAASAGLFAVASTWLAAYGSSLAFLFFAAVGACIAVLDLDPFKWRKAVALLLFNGVAGTFGGPLVLLLVGVDVSSLPKAAMILLAFLLGWSAHPLFIQLRGFALQVMVERMKKKGAGQ